MSTNRQVRRLRVLLAIASVLVAALSLVWWDQHYLLRLQIVAWANGYDGCWCSDCQNAFLGVDYQPFLRGCMPTASADPDDLALRATVVAALLLLLSALGRRPLTVLVNARPRDPFCCQECRYDLRSLPTAAACPECGSRRDGEVTLSGTDRPGDIMTRESNGPI